jgi:hypothetical protein
VGNTNAAYRDHPLAPPLLTLETIQLVLDTAQQDLALWGRIPTAASVAAQIGLLNQQADPPT